MRAFTVCLFSLAIASVAASASADQWEKVYRVGAEPSLVMRVDVASVEVDTWERPEIRVRVLTRSWKIGGNVRVIEDQTGDRVTVELEEPRFRLSIGSDERSVRVEVRAPRSLALDVRSGDGPIEVRPLEGRIHLATGDGAIQVVGLRGDIVLATADGSIRAHAFEGSLAATTGDGSMQIDGRFDELDLETGDGSITADVEPAGSDRQPWTVTTGDGPVLLRLPDDFRADLDARSGDGRIDIDFPIDVAGDISRTAVRGTLNGGGPPLTLRSGDGPVAEILSAPTRARSPSRGLTGWWGFFDMNSTIGVWRS